MIKTGGQPLNLVLLHNLNQPDEKVYAAGDLYFLGLLLY